MESKAVFFFRGSGGKKRMNIGGQFSELGIIDTFLD